MQHLQWLKIVEIPMVSRTSLPVMAKTRWDTPGHMRKNMVKQQDWKKIKWNMRVSHEIEFSSNAKSFHAILPLTSFDKRETRALETEARKLGSSKTEPVTEP